MSMSTKYRTFRSLIRSAVLGSLPLVGAQAGCGTCYDSNQTDIPATAMLRVRLQPQACSTFCGPSAAPTPTCTAVVQGQAAFTIECADGSMPRNVDGAIWGNVLSDDCSLVCGGPVESCTVAHNTDSVPARNIQLCVTSHLCAKGPVTAIEGRRPQELVLNPSQGASDVGQFFAEVMQLEAAAIDAFDILAEELRAHGAPPELVAATERARADEVRHTRMAAALMRRFGGEAERPQVSRRAVRPLYEIALENAVEGCVRESFGAFQASWQAAHATDEVVRAVMRRVARDEVEHAELSFAIAEWIESRLSETERAELAAARAAATTELLAELTQGPSVALLQLAGLPPVEASLSFVRAHAALLPEPPRA
jgi:rubrerythrin